MKLNNEIKIGLLAVIVILVLILGFNFLKGKKLFSHEKEMYAVYTDVMGLSKANPVIINGLQVGKIASLDGGKYMKRILVTVVFSKDVNIPRNSLAIINPNLLGSTSLNIKLGDGKEYLKDGDTLSTSTGAGALDEAMKMIDPVLYEVKTAVRSLDSVLHIITATFDVETKNNVKDIVANLATVTKSFTVSAHSLELMLDAQNGDLSKSLNNVESFTANLNKNSSTIDSIMFNAKKASTNMASLNLKKTMDSLNVAINNFKEGAEKINSKEGSLGLLLNDKELYRNLESTSEKLNILLDDIRVHPKRYLNISVFGKKDRGNYLTAPLTDDTLKVVDP